MLARLVELPLFFIKFLKLLDEVGGGVHLRCNLVVLLISIAF